MKTRVETTGETCIVRIDGRIGHDTAGPFCDLVVALARAGRTGLLIEFGPTAEVSRPAVRGLVVAAKLMQAAGGRCAIVARPGLGAWLHHVSLAHLLPLHPDRASALHALDGVPRATRPRPTTPANRSSAPLSMAAAFRG